MGADFALLDRCMVVHHVTDRAGIFWVANEDPFWRHCLHSVCEDTEAPICCCSCHHTIHVPLHSDTMRLLTHNLLACHAKACQTTSNNFPLILKDVQLELIEAEPNDTFVKGFLPKLDWPALVKTAR